jgi:hypothetical protein
MEFAESASIGRFDNGDWTGRLVHGASDSCACHDDLFQRSRRLLRRSCTATEIENATTRAARKPNRSAPRLHATLANLHVLWPELRRLRKAWPLPGCPVGMRLASRGRQKLNLRRRQ